MDKKKWMIIGGGVGAILLIVLIIIIAVSNGSPSSPGKVTDPELVGICYRDKTTEENGLERMALESFLKEKGLQIMAVDADGDQAKQLEQIKKLSQHSCDSLIIEPVISDAADTLLNAIDATGLPALLFHREMDTALLKSFPKIAYVGWDSSQPGKLQAQMALALSDGGDLNDDGILSYMVVYGPENQVDTAQYQKALEGALANSDRETECLSAVYSDGSYENGKLLATREIAKFGKDIEVIFCANDALAMGSLDAIHDGGRTVGKDVYLFSIGGSVESQKAVSEGNMTGTVYADPLSYRTAIYNTAVAQIRKQPVTQIQIIPYVTITMDTIATDVKKEN